MATKQELEQKQVETELWQREQKALKIKPEKFPKVKEVALNSVKFDRAVKLLSDEVKFGTRDEVSDKDVRERYELLGGLVYENGEFKNIRGEKRFKEPKSRTLTKAEKEVAEKLKSHVAMLAAKANVERISGTIRMGDNVINVDTANS